MIRKSILNIPNSSILYFKSVRFIPKVFRFIIFNYLNKNVYSYFDYLISIGDCCFVASILKRNKLKKETFPFDWVARVDIKSRFELIKNDFKCFYCFSDLEFKKVRSKYVVFNERTKFCHPHDFTEELLNKLGDRVEDVYPEVLKTYRRRISRFYNNLCGKKVLFIYFEGSSQNLYTVDELFNNLQEISEKLGCYKLKLLYIKRSSAKTISKTIERYEKGGLEVFMYKYPEKIAKEGYDTNSKIEALFMGVLRAVCSKFNYI